MPEANINRIWEALEFSRFRFKLIEFLKLPFDIGEPALREMLERTCCGVYRTYLGRSERVKEILKSEDTSAITARIPVLMDHRQGESPALHNLNRPRHQPRMDDPDDRQHQQSQ